MSNNNSMIVLGVAAAMMLCGMAAAIIVCSTNDNTMSSDEADFYRGYDEGFAAAQEFKAANGEFMLFAAEKVVLEQTLKSAYEYGYDCGWADGMGYTNGDGRNYSMYVFYVENFNSRCNVNY